MTVPVNRKRTAAGAAVVLAGLGVTAAGGGRELLRRQAAIARRRIGKPLGEDAIDADKLWKKTYGDPLRLLLLGDSIAAGLGAERRKDTLGAPARAGARQGAAPLGRPAHRGRRGSESSALAAQIDGLPSSYRPDVAVIVVGGNDVTHRVPVSESVEHLEEAIVRLRSRGAVVVVGTCPDLGALREVPQPLRSLGSRMSRQLAVAQKAAAVRCRCARGRARHGGRPVLHHQPGRDVQPRPLPPERAGLQAHGEGAAAVVLTALGVRDEVPFGHHAPTTRADRAEAGNVPGLRCNLSVPPGVVTVKALRREVHAMWTVFFIGLAVFLVGSLIYLEFRPHGRRDAPVTA